MIASSTAPGQTISWRLTSSPTFRDFEPDEVFSKKGGTILVNGETAGFTTPIKHGDTIELIPYGAEIANSGMPEE